MHVVVKDYQDAINRNILKFIYIVHGWKNKIAIPKHIVIYFQHHATCNFRLVHSS